MGISAEGALDPWVRTLGDDQIERRFGQGLRAVFTDQGGPPEGHGQTAVAIENDHVAKDHHPCPELHRVVPIEHL